MCPPHVKLTTLVAGRGTRATASTATVGLAHLVTGLRMATAVIVARSIPTPTAAAHPQTPGATHRAFHPAGMDSVTRYRASSPLVGPRPFLIPRAVRAAADLPATFAGEGEAEAVAANGATTAGMEDATVRTTETDPTLGTSEAASENDYTSGSGSESGNGSATHAIGSISRGPGGRRPLRYEHDRHCLVGISGMREMCL